MIISSFHTGPDRNRVIYILIMRRGHSSVSKQILCLHMDPYVVTFHLGLGIGVIGPAFYIFTYISRYFGPYSIHFFGLLLNREIGLIVHLFDIILIYIRHPPDNSNRSNWMSDSGLYDMTDQQKYSNTPPLSYIPYITLDRYHIHGIRFTFKMPWW